MITYTEFGRNHQEIEGMRTHLRRAEFPEHNALIVGAGLEMQGLFLDMARARSNINWINTKYSWEYLEIASFLMWLGKPWTLTVVDSSHEVVEAIKMQRRVAIAGYGPSIDPARTFLYSFGIKDSDEETLGELNSVNSRLVNFEVFNWLDVPDSIVNRINVIEGRVEDIDITVPQGHYQVVSMFNTSIYVGESDQDGLTEKLLRVTAEDGVIITDHNMKGVRPEKKFSINDSGLYVKKERSSGLVVPKPLDSSL
jgi:hypothetical protein